jgi:hypothetical protein
MRTTTKCLVRLLIALAACAALAAGGAASASSSLAGHPGSIIRATGVRAGAITHMSSSTGALTVKPTTAYADLTSGNWSGYVSPAANGDYTGTSATFTVPADTTCGSTDTASSFWAGLDGWDDSTVEQDGVEDDCADGVQSLYAWVETYPAYEEEIVTSTGAAAPVAPGDTIVSTVAEVSPSEYSMYIDDQTQGWYFEGDLDMPSGYTGDDQTSEVIAEATTECDPTCTIMPLTDFGSVSYSDDYYVDASGSTDFYTSSDTSQIELYQNGGEADGVGELGTDGAFTVTYGTPDHVTVINPGSRSAEVGLPVSLRVRGTSSKGDALSYVAAGLPPGLSISNGGVVSGTPRTTGTYSVKVTATDLTGTSGAASFRWAITRLPAPKPYQCGRRTTTVVHVCWSAVAHATSYSGLLYEHGHSFTTKALSQAFRGLKRNTSYRLRMHASNAAGSSSVVVLAVRTS